MKNLLLLFSLYLLMLPLQAQQCSENTNVNGNAGTGHTPGNNVGQSFTACKTGKLVSVSAVSGNAPSGFNQVLVEIRAGVGFQGALLGRSGLIQVNANRTVTWDLRSLGIIVTEGQEYSTRFLLDRGDAQLKYSTAANTTLDYYPRGYALNLGQSHNDMFFSAVIETLAEPVKSPEDNAVGVKRDTEVKLSFSRSMVALTGDITINNTTNATSETVDVTTLTIDGTDVFMPLSTPLEGGKDFEIIIPANVLEATNGIPFPGISAGEWTFTTSTKPYATLSTTSEDLTNDAVFPFTIEFSDVVTGFDLTDFVITNGVASNLAGSDDSFTFDITPSADGEVVLSLPPNVVEAGTSNGNDSTGYALVYDGTVPSVSLNTDETGTIQASVFEIEVVFSEPVVGFESSDLIITNADILSNTSTKDSLFTISLRAQAEGQITVDLLAGIADDLAGNANTAAPAIIDLTYSVDLESNMISYYPFDGNANDTVSTGFNGTVSGVTLTTGFNGTTDGAYSFDGTDIITFGDTPIGEGSFTIAFWVKIPEGLAQNQVRTILAKREACTEGRFFEINYNNSSANGHQISVDQRSNAGMANPVANLASVGGWTHIAYVKDNEQLQSSLYVNGVQQTPVALTGARNFENVANLRAGISACNGNGRFRFNGEMDDIYVYGRALTAVEVDLLSPLIIQNVSDESGSDIQAGQAIELNFNKNLQQSSVNTTNITATSTGSGSVNLSVTSSDDNLVITPPATGWPLDEDVTISISGLLAQNGTTLPDTDLTYSVIADEAVGLILHYPISGNANEAIGEIAGQDGTISGALFVEGVDGDAFGALSFDGTDDVVTLGDAPISTESFSISLRVKVPVDGSTTASTIVLSKREACTEGRLFYISYLRSGDKFRFSAAMRSNASAGSVSTGYAFPVDEWVNLTLVKDNSTQKYRLIVNGVLEGEGNWLLSSVNVENSAPIRLGGTPCNGVNGTPRFDGLMDDIRIYDRAIQPRVTSIEPSKGTVNAATDTVVTIAFDRVVDVSSLEASSININDIDGASYPYTAAFSKGDSVLTITPDNDLPKGKKIIVSVDTLSAIIGSGFLPFQTSFTTVSSQLLSHSPANGVSDVDSLGTISFKFDNDMSMSSLETGIRVIGSQHGPVQGNFAMPTTDSVVFTPSRAYFPNEVITVYVTPSLLDIGGEPIGNNKAFTFHVASPLFVNPTLSFESTKLTTSLATSAPRDLVAADLDNDGDLDLIGGDENPGTLFWFENQGFGNFSDGIIIDSNNDYWDIEATDFDLDGDMDIVTICRLSGKGVYWYENNGTASFTERLIKSLSGSSDLRALKAADFNNDGSMDVATVDYGFNKLVVYDKDGTELFAAANVGGPLDVQIADRENDGDLDIYLANYTSGNVAYLANTGNATFSGVALHSASQMRAVIPIDFDKDGDIDIVYSAQSASQIGILENTGNSTYTNHQVGSIGGPHRIDVGDIDGDGDFDIIYSVAAGNADINFYYLENSGSFGLWTPQKLLPNATFSGASTQTIKFADIDNDGDLDVLATDAGTGFYVFENKIIDLNNGPILENPIADQSLEEDSEVGLTINVSNVFVDAEDDAYTLEATTDNAAITAVINGDNLELNTVTPDFFGDVNITLTADDGNGINTDIFLLSVTPVNDAPAFDLSSAAVTVDEDFTTTETITVTQNQPAGEDAPTYSIAPTSTIANVSIDSNTGEITITSVADAFGSQEFTITANDGGTENSTATQTFTLTVNAINDAPEVANVIDDIAFDEDSSGKYIVDITNTFSDVEDVRLTLGLNILAGSDLVNISFIDGTASISPTKDAFGTVQVEVTAEDAAGATAADTFDIVINPVNDAPSFTTSGDLTLFSNSTSVESVTVTEDESPFGEGDQVITYSLSPGSVSFANVSIDQATGAVSVSAIADTEGTQEFTITADDGQAENNTASQTFILTVINKTAQTATFTGVTDKTFGDADFTISSTVDSELPVTFTVISGGLSITQSGVGTTGGGSADFTVTGAGTAVVQASNDGDDTYAALQETITIEIAKADQTLSIESIDDQSQQAAPITVTASVNTNLTLDYAVSGPATISGNVVTLDGTLGTVTVTVSQAGTDNYNPASQSVSFEVIEKQSQTITFIDIADEVTYGAADITLSATSTSNLPVTFSIVSGTASLTGNVLSFTQVGEVVIAANQTGDGFFLAATTVEQTIMVAQAPLIITADDQVITYGDAIPALTYEFAGFVNGEGESDLLPTVAINIIGEGVEGPVEAGFYDIELTLTAAKGVNNYDITLVNATLTVEKAAQLITIETIEDKMVDDAAFDVVASSDQGLELDYTITGPATITGTTITLDGTSGTVEVTVSQVGTNNYLEASATTSFEVTELVTGVKELTLSGSVSIYPNPVSDYLMIDTQESVDLEFYSLDGSLVKAIKQAKGSVAIDKLPAGVYMLQIVGEEAIVTKRIVKVN